MLTPARKLIGEGYRPFQIPVKTIKPVGIKGMELEVKPIEIKN